MARRFALCVSEGVCLLAAFHGMILVGILGLNFDFGDRAI